MTAPAALEPPARPPGLPPALRRASAVVSMAVLVIVITVAVFAEQAAPHSYREQDPAMRLQPPGPDHLLGTDEYGRDVLSRLIYGARISLSVALIVQAFELAVGLFLGILAGYRGGRFDAAIMRVADVMFGFPDVLLAILIMGTLGRSMQNVFLALALVGWPGMVRLVRSQVLSVREREFVQAARALGASDLRIMVRHLLPNVIGPAMVAATVGVGSLILAESTLSFLGLGIQPPYPSWGAMVSSGWQLRRSDPMLTLYPGLCLAITIMAFNLLGDALRDWLDPRTRR